MILRKTIIMKRPGMGVMLFITGFLIYTTSWVLFDGFEKRVVPEDFLNRYLPIARGITTGGDFLLNGRAPSPPIYPLALAGLARLGMLFHISPTSMAKVFNVLIMALLAVLFYALAAHFLGQRTGLVTALVWLTYPFGIYLTLQPGPEPLYLLFLLITASTVLTARDGNPMACLAAGTAGALTMLVKPIALFMPLALLGVLSVTWIWRRVPFGRFVLSCSLFIAGLLFVVLPWEVYLWQRTGRVIPVAEIGGASIREGWTFGLRAGVGGDRFLPPKDVEKYMIEVEKMSQGGDGGDVIGAILKAAQKRPIAFIKLLLIKAGRCWYGTDEMWHEGKILTIQLFYLALSLIGAVFWFRSGRPGWWLMAVLGVVLIYHWAAATVVLSILRYMVPAGFLMAVMVASVIVKLSSSKNA